MQSRSSVTINQEKKTPGNTASGVWGVLLAAAAALICVAIDYVTQEEEKP